MSRDRIGGVCIKHVAAVIVGFIGFALLPVAILAQCESASVALPDNNAPVPSTSGLYCVDFTIDPSVTGHPEGISLHLDHTWQGDLSIRVFACGETLMILTRPGGGNCNGGSPFGSSATVNGVFTFQDIGPNPDNGLAPGGGNYGLSGDPCNLNTVNSFDDLADECGSDPYTFTICIGDHAFGDIGFASDISPIFDNPPTCGCTDPDASNYDPDADVDDGSCEYPPCEPDADPTIVDIDCSAGTLGSISLDVTGGSGAYDFDWSPNVSNSNEATDLEAGTYQVTITDSNDPDCISEHTYEILEGGVLDIDFDIFPTSCGLDNGGIELSPQGSGSYSYDWTGPSGISGSGASDMQAGAYTVTVTDDLTGCETILNLDVPDSDPLDISATIEDADCDGSLGSAQLSVTGGSGNFSYNWDPSVSTEESASDLDEGTYSVTVEDNEIDGCESEIEIEIEMQGELDLDITIDHTTCQLANGFISVSPDGPGPFSYDWNGPGAITGSEGGDLEAGFYDLTVTDDNTGCEAETTIEIEDSDPLDIFATIEDADCDGSLGSAQLSVTDGSGNYSYNWDPAVSNDASASDLVEGTYTVTVEDAEIDGCEGEFTIEIGMQGELDLDIIIDHTTCQLDNGAISVTPDGPGPFSYFWDGPTAITGSEGEDLEAGFYNLTVTDDITGCETETTIQIEGSDPLDVSATIENADCDGGLGSAQLSVTGGSGNFSYNWDPTVSTDDTASDLDVGTYSVTVEDAEIDGCEGEITIEIEIQGDLDLDIIAVHTTCQLDNGSIFVTPDGPGPFSYFWDGPTTITGSEGEDLESGLYNLTVTDDITGCETETTIELEDSDPLDISATIENADCDGGFGSAQLSVSGGSGNFSYNWDPAVSTDATASDLDAGTYSVTVEDAEIDGCEGEITIEIEIQGDLDLDIITVHTTCQLDNGSISVTPDGPGPFSYFWDGPTTITGSEGEDLESGFYNLTVTDDLTGCETETTIEIEDSDPLDISTTIEDADCDGSLGSAQLSVTGGSGNFSYNWDPAVSNDATASDLDAGTYSVTVEDNEIAGCEGEIVIEIEMHGDLDLDIAIDHTTCQLENGSISVTPTGPGPFSYFWDGPSIITGSEGEDLESGFYNLTVTDDLTGCETETTIEIEDSDPLDISATTENADCDGSLGSAELIVTGGSGNFSYNWDPAVSTDASASDLDAGTYSVTVEDNEIDGCEGEITIEIEMLGELNLDITLNHTTCQLDNGSISISPDGPGPFSYFWDGPTAISGSAGEDLESGFYNLTVTDDITGCEAETNIEIEDSDPLDISATTEDADCDGSLGSAQLSVSGGSGNFSYNWDPPVSNDATASDLNEGIYSVTVEDDEIDGCEGEIVIEIEMLGELNLDITLDHTTCQLDNGSISVSPDGPGPFSYDWIGPTAITGSEGQNLSSGTYDLTVTDDFTNCTAEAQIEIDPSDSLHLTTDIEHPQCDGTTGSIEISASGTGGSYNYTWSDPQLSGPEVDELEAGVFTVTVTDPDIPGCESEEVIELIWEGELPVEITATEPSCNESNGELFLDPFGNESFEYEWSVDNPSPLTGDGGTGIEPGTYWVTVTGTETFCTAELEIELDDIPPFDVDIEIVHPDCYEDNGSITLNPDVPGSYEYSWGSGNQLEDLGPGLYDFIVTDVQTGCVWRGDAELEYQHLFDATVEAFDPSCGEDDGEILISPDGSGDYSYQWDGPGNATGHNPTDIPGGDWSVTITDDLSNCTLELDIILGITEPFDLDSVIEHPFCSQADGSIWVTPQGGGPFEYEWDPGNLIQGMGSEDLAAGIYQLTVTNTANGCELDFEFELTTDPPLEVSSSVSHPSCETDDGEISLSPDGTSPYDYEWSGPVAVSGESGENLPGGMYWVTVTELQTGCFQELEIELEAPVPFTTESFVQQPSCQEEDGVIEVETDISGDFDYQWSGPFPIDGSIGENLPPGSYSLLIEDLNTGCTDFLEWELIAPEPFDLDYDSEDTNCGLDNGSVSVFPSGNGPYEYDWSGPVAVTGDSGTGLEAGIYTLTVTDINTGCTEEVEISIESSEGLDFDYDLTNPSCGEDNGSIQLIPQVPGSFIYQWNGPVPLDGDQVEDLPAGFYSLTVIDQDTGCEWYMDFHLQTDAPFDAEIDKTHSTCGDNNGSIEVQTDGQGPFDFEWDGPVDVSGTGGTSLPAGNYLLTITDQSDGCSREWNIELIDSGSFSADFELLPQDCDTGLGGISIETDGEGPFDFQWSSSSIPNSPQADSLPPGIYEVTVTQTEFQCAEELTIEIDSLLLLSINATVENTSCGEDNGSIFIEPDGSGNFTIDWSGPVSVLELGDSILPAGAYSVTITDTITGCTKENEFTIQDSELPEVDIEKVQPDCGVDNGEIWVVNTGGQPFVFEWTGPVSVENTGSSGLPAGVYLLNVTDTTTGCSNQYSMELTGDDLFEFDTTYTHPICEENDGSILVEVDEPDNYDFSWSGPVEVNGPGGSDLPSGTYSATITEISTGCSRYFELELEGGTPLEFDFDVQNTSCGLENGGIVANPLRPGDYSFYWDANPGDSILSEIGPGTYTLIIEEESNSCTAEYSFEVEESVAPGLVLFEECQSDGEHYIVSGFVENGSPEYTSIAGGVDIYFDQDSFWSDPIPGGNSYEIQISDSNGCLTDLYSGVKECECTTSAGELPDDTLSACIEEPVEASIISGTSVNSGSDVFSYILYENPLDPLTSLIATSRSGIFYFDSTEMTSGQFYYISHIAGAPDENDNPDPNSACFDIGNSQPVKWLDYPEISAGYQLVATCEGYEAVLFVEIHNSSQSGYIDYQWFDENGQPVAGENVPDPTIFNSGHFVLQSFNSARCEAIDTIEVTIPEFSEIEVDVFVTDPTCPGESDGSVMLEITGGEFSPYTVSMGGEIHLEDHIWDNMSAGIYEFTIRDSLDCTKEVQIELDEPVGPVISLGEDISTTAGSEVSIEAGIEGGDLEIIHYQWEYPSGELSCSDCRELTFTVEQPGHVQLTVTDANGCKYIAPPIMIRISGQAEIYVPNAFSPNGDGVNDIFKPYFSDSEIKIEHFEIYDRWGTRVFSQKHFQAGDQNTGWDGTFRGKEMGPGAYIFSLRAVENTGKIITMSGDFLLLR